MSGPFRSLFTREREFPSRVKTELERHDRERLAIIVDSYEDSKAAALESLKFEMGYTRLREETPNETPTEIIMSADTIVVLSYLEHMLNHLQSEFEKAVGSGNPSKLMGLKSKLNNLADNIQEVLVTEGLLWEMVRNDDQIRFRQIESEAMEDIDQEIQALAEEEPWDDALKGYNEAFNRYLEGAYDEQIPKKLYYSIEEVLKTICVDLEEWTDNRELSHSRYLGMMKDNDFYHSHGATAKELNQLVDSLDTMVAKVGGDRKQRHAWHDRTYATLLIHQVGAYLYFLINRHKEIAGQS